MKKLVVLATLVAFSVPFAKVKAVSDSALKKDAPKGTKKKKKSKKVKADSAKPAAPAVADSAKAK